MHMTKNSIELLHALYQLETDAGRYISFPSDLVISKTKLNADQSKRAISDLHGQGFIDIEIDGRKHSLKLTITGRKAIIPKHYGTENSSTVSDPAPAKSDPAKSNSPVRANLIYCSFCGKSQNEVKKLVAGPQVFICDECIALTVDLVDEGQKFSHTLKFPPEYRQSGLDILNYFGTVVQQKYPNIPVKVRIEQEGATIRMVIYSAEGELEKVEDTLKNYALVIAGRAQPESLGLGELETIELRAELRLAHVRIENQKELLTHKNIQIEQLFEIITRGLATAAQVGKHPQVTFAPTLQQTVTVSNINLSQQFADLSSTLKELDAMLPAPHPASTAIKEAAAIVTEAAAVPNTEELKKSGLIGKLGTAVTSISEAFSKMTGKLKIAEGSIDAVKRLVGYYNNIAPFLGLPTIPLPR